MLTVRELSEVEFEALADEWHGLLVNSGADRLFMSWSWQYSWWETWGEALGLELYLLAVYRSDGLLVGLAPLYKHEVKTPLGWRFRRLHVIGNAWKLSPTVRTEYVSLVAKQEEAPAVLSAICGHLLSQGWSEFIIADACTSATQALEQGFEAVNAGVQKIIRNESEGVLVETQGSLSDWRAALGRQTRLKVFNRRQIFERELGGVYKVLTTKDKPGTNLANWVAPFFDRLNQLHIVRWGKPCFDQNAVRFHIRLLSRLSSDQDSRLSVLLVDEQAVSVLYDIRAGNRIYNLQAGFDERLHGKISLGSLHLGYAIEAAFGEPGVTGYDLLAGSGKHTFYKSHFKGISARFTTAEYVRSPLLKALFVARGFLPNAVVSSINRFFRL